MWILEKVGDTFNIPVKQYLITSDNELQNLPKGTFGDRAIDMEGNIYYWDPETEDWPAVNAVG